MLTPEDIRNPARKSGFDYVGSANPSSKQTRTRNFWRARAYGGKIGKMGAAWTGPTRQSAEQAAQDYCDWYNGLPLAARATPEPDLQSRKRTLVTSTTIRKDGFPVAMKRAIHARADGQCENCGIEYPHPDAHHIDADGDHSLTNGASICKNCHGITYLGSTWDAEAINKKLRALREAEINVTAAVQLAA